MMTAPGFANCTCNKGWIGDGVDCYLETVCANHADCDVNADCVMSAPGKVLFGMLPDI